MTHDTTHKLLADGVVNLRALEPTDIDLLYQWENDTSLWTVTDTMAPYSRKLIWQYLNQFDGDVFQTCQLRLMVALQATGATMWHASGRARATATARLRCSSTMPTTIWACTSFM